MQGQNIDPCNQAISTPIEGFPSSCHAHPHFEKGRNSQLKPLVWDFKELGRNGLSGKGECDLHGKSRSQHLLLHQVFVSKSPGGAAPWEWPLGGKWGKQASTGKDRGLCLWEKDSQGTFRPRGWGKGLQSELNVWKLNSAQSINYLIDSDPLLLQEQV